MDSDSVRILVKVISSLINIIPTIVLAVATFFAAIATFFAAGVAIWGIRSWRKEFIGKRKIELVSNTLSLFHKTKSAIRYIRSPWAGENEGTTRKIAEDEDPMLKRFRDQAYVTIERFNKNVDIFNQLIAEKFKFMVEFGKDTKKHFDSIKCIIDTILVYAYNYPDYMMERHDLEKERQSLLRTQDSNRIKEVGRKLEGVNEEIKEYESFLYYQGKGDTVEKNIDSIILEIEKIRKEVSG